jgi:hypothetical protein
VSIIYPIFLGIFGAILGLTFADIDLAPPLPLKHRSAWTHGPLVPYAAPFLIGLYPALWPFVTCFLVTYGLHLVADMFPRMWSGSALINLYPLHLSLPPLLSFVWLAVGVGYTYYTWLLLLDLPTDWLWPR